MKRWYVVALAAVIIVGLIFFASREEPIAVNIVEAERGSVEQTVSNTRAGTVKACQRSRLSLPIGGQIAKIYVREGEAVEEGQLLLSLWNDDRAAQLEQARAQLLTAEKERDSACIAARSDGREAKRQSRLLEKKLTSEELADLAQSKAEASSASCEAAKARKGQANASVQLAEALLRQTYLRAPFSGEVAEVTGELGEFSTPSPPGVPTPPAVDLLTADCHYINAPIDEVDASHIRIGLPVRITMDAFRDQVFIGEVSRIGSYVQDYEKQARTVDVEAQLRGDNPQLTLLAGYSADMEIILESKSDALRVPSETIIDEKGVLILQQGKLHKREITTGLANWHFTEILSGLTAGEQVVTNIGSEGVIDGAAAEKSIAP